MFLEMLKDPDLSAQSQSYLNELKDGRTHELPQSPFMIQPGMPQSQQPMIMNDDIHAHVEVEESLNIVDKEKELIVKALKKHKGKRKDAALDLGISERTLYRKLKEYDIEE
jgi:DNA-binding NtrC family response regulator